MNLVGYSDIILKFLFLEVVMAISWLFIFHSVSVKQLSVFNYLTFFGFYIFNLLVLCMTPFVYIGEFLFPFILVIIQVHIIKDDKVTVKEAFFSSFYSFDLGFILFWLYNLVINTVLYYLLDGLRITTISVVLASILTSFTQKILQTTMKKHLGKYYLGKLRNTRVLSTTNFILCFTYSVLLISYLFSSINSSIHVGKIIKYIFIIGIPILILLLLYITFKSQLAAKEEINQLQKTQLDNLAVYTEEIEKMYQTLRGFRHDYQNVLLSLQESIDSEDIEQIKQVYQETLASADVRLVRQIEATNVNELANIHDSAVKSVMFWKITQARDRKVAVDVEIKEEIPRLSMSSLHFIRIFSILMDNAIEEAKRTVSPKISIALFVNQGDIIFIVSNSTLLTSVNINQLKKPGYTTKGKNRGIGLSNVDEILTQYSNCYLETELENGVFTQRLVMEGIEE